MIIHEVGWLRSKSSVLCPRLRRCIVEKYRVNRYIPCFLQTQATQWRNNHTKIPVIIQSKPNIKTSQRHLTKVLSENQVKHRLPIVESIAAELRIMDIQALANENWVKKIWLDHKVHAVLDIAGGATGADRVWEWGFTGEGVTVAVLDTGIHPHPDLIEPYNRIVAFRDFVNQKSHPYDDNGHGTHVAGDIAGNGGKSNGRYKGTAPRANLVGIKVMNKDGSGLSSNVIAGIQWCIDNKEKYNIKIMNMSLGSMPSGSYKEDLVAIAAAKAWEAGIVVCAAAGNEGPERGTISSPGIHPTIITVGAMDDRDTKDRLDDIIADFSSRGPTRDGLVKPDIVAPGTGIVSLRAAGSTADKELKKNRVGKWYISMSGTSMATPICAGIVATLIQLHPEYSPDQIKRLVLETAEDLKLDRKIQGQGYIDAFKAVSTINKV